MMTPRARPSPLPSLPRLRPPASRGPTSEGANWKRLEAMPREQRLHLSQTLEEFDSLPSGDRAAIRDLDASLAKLPPETQARYRVVLRRYHVWVDGLDDVQKKKLAEAGSVDAKLSLVTKWRKAEREAETRVRKNLIFGIHPSDLNTIPPFEMAYLLRVWRKLDAKDRAEVEKIERMPQRLMDLGGRGSGARSGSSAAPSPRGDGGRLGQAGSRTDEKVKSIFPRWVAKTGRRPIPIAEKRAAKRPANPIHQMAESLYFIENPPEPVAAARLAQFDATIPNWLRATLDPLPPDEARRQLTILYRQIYPPGQDIPPPNKAEQTKPKATPKPSGARRRPLAPF